MKLRRLGALAGAFLLTFGLVSSVFANAANPESIKVEVSGTSVTLSGTWSWLSQPGACSDRWVGWAVDWADPNSAGNAVGNTGFDVGTPSDNAVHTNENCGALDNGLRVGTWGDISHTYSEAGTYHACVLMYDIHQKDGVAKSGELIAGGADRNKDNSAETNGQTPEGGEGVACIPADIVIKTNPGISIDKTADPTAIIAGADVTYSYVVTNTGDVDLVNVSVSDDNGTPGDTTDDFGTPADISCPKTALAVDEHMTCTATVSGTQVTTTNIAVATGWTDKEEKVTDDDDATVTVGTGSVAAETDTPTAPPTDAITSTTTDAGGALPLLLLVLGVIGVGAVVLTPRRARR